jgi:hypothetical protein
VLLPAGRRGTRSDVRMVAAYLGGTLLGSLLTVTVAWVLSGFAAVVPATWRAALLGAGALVVCLAKDGPLVERVTLPESRRQIPAEVFNRSLIQGAFSFGFQLGTGVRTYVPSSAPYVLLLAILLGWLTFGWALLLAVGFGLGRAVPLIIYLVAMDRTRFASESYRQRNAFAATFPTALVLAGALYLV